MLKLFGSMPHVVFGVLGIVMLVWVLVELLNISEKNQYRLKVSSVLSSVFIWLAFIVGGWWYWVYYGAKDVGDKYIILSGAFPEAHKFFMEGKEHIFFILLILSLLLPIVVFKNDLVSNKQLRKLTITIAIIGIIIGFVMEGFGSFITKGVTIGLTGGI